MTTWKSARSASSWGWSHGQSWPDGRTIPGQKKSMGACGRLWRTSWSNRHSKTESLPKGWLAKKNPCQKDYLAEKKSLPKGLSGWEKSLPKGFSGWINPCQKDYLPTNKGACTVEPLPQCFFFFKAWGNIKTWFGYEFKHIYTIRNNKSISSTHIYIYK